MIKDFTIYDEILNFIKKNKRFSTNKDTDSKYDDPLDEMRVKNLIYLSNNSFYLTENGLYAIELGGYEKWIENKESINTKQSIVHNNLTINGNNNQGIVQDSVLKESLFLFGQTHIPPIESLTQKKSQEFWDKAKTIATILGFLAAVIGIVKYLGIV